MRRHTLIGERIAQGAPALVGVGRLIRSSHERWDGGGYPDGLAGDAIPLGAQIVFVCDAFSAMTTDRVLQARDAGGGRRSRSCAATPAPSSRPRWSTRSWPRATACAPSRSARRAGLRATSARAASAAPA